MNVLRREDPDIVATISNKTICSTVCSIYRESYPRRKTIIYLPESFLRRVSRVSFFLFFSLSLSLSFFASFANSERRTCGKRPFGWRKDRKSRDICRFLGERIAHDCATNDGNHINQRVNKRHSDSRKSMKENSSVVSLFLFRKYLFRMIQRWRFV